jgi:hypothetical protein
MLRRRRIQQATCGHRGRKGDPLYAARRTLHTGSDLLTDKQRQRLTALSEPHQLHRQIASGDRRVQAPTTPSIMKSHFTST